ncbi:MAG: hypothetical protein GY745_01440 [Actinomycetia bacterium]|nr:hypothetical protein [Actinomycetes bacterium]
MSELVPIESHLRNAEVRDPTAALVFRGWPLTVEGLLRNADATRRRYSLAGESLVAISAEVTMPGWDVESIVLGVCTEEEAQRLIGLLGDARPNPHHVRSES